MPNGGWSDDPSDPGGATQWGIASKFNPEVASLIKKGRLSKEKAANIYYSKYYKPILGIDRLPAQIAYLLFDSRVHGTIRVTTKELQSLINLIAVEKLKVDGLYGRNTFRAIQRLSSAQVQAILRTMRLTSSFRARKVAVATMATQRRLKKPVKDYTAGFTSRFENRLKFAAQMS